MKGGPIILFVSLALLVWGTVHLYVFWRLNSVPWVARHISPKALGIVGTVLWLSYLLARRAEAMNLDWLAAPLEYAAAIWLGVAMLLFFALLAVELVTLGGWFLPQLAPALRGGAAAIALTLALIALIQGHRAPVVTEYDVTLPDLPEQLEGQSVVVISDLHLGPLTRQRWLADLVAQLNKLKPQLILAVGDIVDGHARHIRSRLAAMKDLHAPLGLWAVTGNHEFYVGVEASVAALREAGWHVLRDEAVTISPGLVLAGVDDLTARQQFGDKRAAVAQTLTNRPPGATILLCHTPWQAERAAELGAALMLSGHTHAGQVWPFNWFVKLRYPLMSGRYDVNGMPLLVCRGTGTWGPPMRLWQRSEILRLTLHHAPAGP